jgi:hypothetical protein
MNYRYQWRKRVGLGASDSLAESKHATEVRALSLNRLLKETDSQGQTMLCSRWMWRRLNTSSWVAWRAHPH